MADIGPRIDQEVAANKVQVYSKSWCPFCTQTKNLLSQKGVAFNVVELDQLGDGDQIQNVLHQKTGQRTVPSIWINGQFLGGNSELQTANSNGSLDAKLNA